jgi:hypothetical protein
VSSPAASPRGVALLIATLALAGSAPAFADSSTSGTVPPGGSLRSSTDGEPSPATPVIVTVTTSGQYPSCQTNCSQGDSQITIALKDAHAQPAPGGVRPFDYVGSQVDVASSQNLNIARLVFDVDSSIIRPNFAYPSGEFQAGITRPGDIRSYYGVEKPGSGALGAVGMVETLPSGDVRITLNSGTPGGPPLATSSIDLLQQGWWVNGYEADTDLDTALGSGVNVTLYASYKAAEAWTITVSPAVAKKLKLKGTTIGRASFPTTPGPTRRIALTPAARKALRKYSRVAVKVNLVAKETGGEVHRHTWALKLAKAEDELG